MTTSTGILFGDPQVKPLSATGTYQPGCYLYFYLTGTTTETNVYSNATLTTALAQPITADSTGRFAPIYLNPATLYRVQLYNSGGTKLEDTDPYVVPVVGAFLWPLSALEVSNGVSVTNFGYEWGDPRRYGALGNGSHDDTAALQAAANSGVWKLTPGSSYYISSPNQITLDYVNIIPALASSITASPNAAIVGTGSLRGVVTNSLIPHQLFQVKYNLVTAAERAPVTITANYWVDPLLGSDSNAGTSPATAVATLAKAAELIMGVASTAPSLLIVLRSGRHEQSLAGLTLSNFQSLSSGGTVTWTGNPGELPVVTPTTYWFFNSSMKTVNYNGCYGVSNTAGFSFCDLFDAETGLPVSIASNLRPNWGLPRNQVVGGQIPISGSAGSYTIQLTLTADDTAAWNAMSTTEQGGVQLRITQEFTSSWHDGLSLSGSVMTMNCYVASSTQTAYFNGFSAIVGGNIQGAPYFMRNLKYYLDGTNFAAYSDNVYLPNRGTNYFTVDNTCTALVSMSTAAKHIWQGIAFRYQTAQIAQMTPCWHQSTPSPYNNLGLLVGGAGIDLQALDCFFEYTAFAGFQLGFTGSQALRNRINHVGMSGIAYSNAANGADSSLVKWNKIRNWGELHIQVAGIMQGGVSLACILNDVRNGASQGIHFDSAQVQGASSGPASGGIQNNIVLNIGMIDGAVCDLYAAGDTGAVYVWGDETSAWNPLSMRGNVIGPSFAYGVTKGIYLDGGCNGVSAYGNLVWGTPDYALYVFQIGGNTNNNLVRNNLLLGGVWFDSASSPASDFSNNVIGGLVGSMTQNASAGTLNPCFIASSPSVIFTEPNQYGCRADVGGDYPVIWSNDPAWQTLMSGAEGSSWLIDPFVLSYVRRGSLVNCPSPIYNSASMPSLPITATTYTVQDNDHTLVFHEGGTCTVSLPPWRGAAGRELLLKTVSGAVVSGSSNVYPQSSLTLGTAILAATAGKFARLKSDGTGNWWITESN